METPKDMAEPDFTRRGSGYDVSEVDRFVASMRGEVDRLQRQIQRVDPANRAQAAGGNAQARRDGKLHDPDRAVERMLAAAQQTADRVVYDAESEADRLVAEAESEAERLISEAQAQSRRRLREVEAQGEKIRREAVTEARRVVEETRQPLAREVRRLRGARDELRAEIEMLKRYLSEHRTRISATGDALKALADDPNSLRTEKLPAPTDVQVDTSDDFSIDVGADLEVKRSSLTAEEIDIEVDELDDDVQTSSLAERKNPTERVARVRGPLPATDEGDDVPWADEPSVSAYTMIEVDDDDDEDDDDDDGGELTQAVSRIDHDDDDEDDGDSGGTVIAGAFASVLQDADTGASVEEEEVDIIVGSNASSSGGRFRDGVGSDSDDDDGGFFASQIDD